MHFPDLILQASRHVASITMSYVVPEPTEVEIETVLATLLDRANSGTLTAPGSTAFLFAEWDPQSRTAVALYEAVAQRLTASGFDVRVATAETIYGIVPKALYVTFASLHRVAKREQERRAVIVVEARTLWKERVGESEADVQAMDGPDGEVLLFHAPASMVPRDPLDRRPDVLRRPEHKTNYGWSGRDATALVKEAVDALKIPRWTFKAVAEAWTQLTGGTVAQSRGEWRDGRRREVATLIFAVENAEEKTYPVDEVYTLTMAELVLRASSEMGVYMDAGALKTVLGVEITRSDDYAQTFEPTVEEQAAIRGGATSPPAPQATSGTHEEPLHEVEDEPTADGESSEAASEEVDDAQSETGDATEENHTPPVIAPEHAAPAATKPAQASPTNGGSARDGGGRGQSRRQGGAPTTRQTR